MGSHHVCFGADLSCSGANACPYCEEMREEHVEKYALEAMQVTVEQVAIFFEAKKTAWRTFQERMHSNDELGEMALDLGRVTIAPKATPVPRMPYEAPAQPPPFRFRKRLDANEAPIVIEDVPNVTDIEVENAEDEALSWADPGPAPVAASDHVVASPAIADVELSPSVSPPVVPPSAPMTADDFELAATRLPQEDAREIANGAGVVRDA